MRIERTEEIRYKILLPPGPGGEIRELTITSYSYQQMAITYEEVEAMQHGLNAMVKRKAESVNEGGPLPPGKWYLA